MGRNRKTDRGLPKYMYRRSGAFYFVKCEPGKKQRWIRLSANYAEAMRAYADLSDDPFSSVPNFDDFIVSFCKQVLPMKSEATQKEYLRQLQFLRAGFGSARVCDIRRTDVRLYLRERTRLSGPVAANREVALLSSMMGWAVDWGVAESNPCIGVKRNPERPRKRLPTMKEFEAFRDFAGAPISQFMDLCRLTALRRSDLLRIRLSDIREGFLHVQTNKTGRALAIEITPALQDAINKARLLRRPISSMHLICKRNGSPYTPDGFSSLWQRKMKAAIGKSVLVETFTMHDIRAMSASSVSAKHAQELLGHSDTKITNRYRRGPEKVKPIE